MVALPSSQGYSHWYGANTPGKALLTQVLPPTIKGHQHGCGLPTGKQSAGFLFV